MRKQPQNPQRPQIFLFCVFCVLCGRLAVAAPDPKLPRLDQPVNDFARIVDAESAAEMSRMIRALQTKTGDVIVVATVPTIEPYGDIREYANKLFENGGRGIGEKGKDNGALVLLALKERKVWIEVGYGLEADITDGYAGETSRDDMVPEFRNGRFGTGLLNGTSRIVARIAEGRNVTLTGVDLPRRPREAPNGIPLSGVILLFFVIAFLSRLAGGRGIRRWGGGPWGLAGWSGWSSGIGPFGGGVGNHGGGDKGVDTKVESGKDQKDNPLLAVLKDKCLEEKSTADPEQGLLYFPIDGKVKPKDLRILYKGPAGRLEIDFVNPKK